MDVLFGTLRGDLLDGLVRRQGSRSHRRAPCAAVRAVPDVVGHLSGVVTSALERVAVQVGLLEARLRHSDLPGRCSMCGAEVRWWDNMAAEGFGRRSTTNANTAARGGLFVRLASKVVVVALCVVTASSLATAAHVVHQAAALVP